MTAPDGRITTYAYDANNRLTQLTDNGNSYSFTYDNLGRRTGLTNPNGTYTTYDYDADNRLTGLVTKTSAGAVINSISHGYDKTMNRTTKVEPTGTTSYSYDATYRLLKSTLGATTKELFTYDATGNRTSGPQASTASTIEQGNRLTAYPNVTLTYDNNGNITGKATLNGTYSYLYDGENRLTEVRFDGTVLASYTYDPFGRRIEKHVVSPAITYKYLYDSVNILYEYDESGAVKTRYTHNLATDDPLGIESYGTQYTYHKDTLGSIRAVTNGAQATVNTYRYDSFGVTTQYIGNGGLLQPYAYTGREYDWETGLYHYRARTYDSRIGRFLQKDPIGFAGGDVNLYGYVQNNPVNFKDPSGLYTLNWFNQAKDPGFWQLAEQKHLTDNDPNILNIEAHGSSQSVGGRRIDQLVNDILNSGYYKKGMTIRLNACNTANGPSSIAEQLSKLLGEWVIGSGRPVMGDDNSYYGLSIPHSIPIIGGRYISSGIKAPWVLFTPSYTATFE